MAYSTCLLASTGNLVGTFSFPTFTFTATGLQTMDGSSVLLGDIVLVKNQSTQSQNGVYFCSRQGAMGVSCVLTLVAGFQTANNINTYGPIVVTSGETQESTVWIVRDFIPNIGSNIVIVPLVKESTNIIYVNPQTGDDANGNGSLINPYATIAQANGVLSSNFTPSNLNRYVVYIQGSPAEVSITIKPYVSYVGLGTSATQVSVTGGGANVTLDSAWSGKSFADCTIENINFVSSTNLNFSLSGVAGSAVRIYLQNVTATNLTVVGRASALDELFVSNNCSFASTSSTDFTVSSSDSFYSSISYVSTNATSALTWRSNGDIVGNNITVSETSAQTTDLFLNYCNVAGSISVTGATAKAIIDSVSYPQGGWSFASGGSSSSVIANPNLVPVTSVTTATYTALVSDNILSCNRAGTIAITLYSSPATGSVIEVNDASGAASTNNITITPAAGNLNGASNYVINTNYGSVTLYYNGTQWITLIGSGATSGIVPLSRGGTSASLTASNGGIFYSTASAGAILSGTATASQVLLSGSSAAPTWSTATYPSSTTVSQILYSSATNVIGGITTANNGALITSGGGVPSISSTLPSAVQTNITSVGTVTTGVWNAGNVTTSGLFNIPTTSSSTVGVIQQNGSSFIHSFGTNNLFVGASSGNFTLTGFGNVGLGPSTNTALTNGTDNISAGYLCNNAITTGSGNIAIGRAANSVNVGGTYNVAVGYAALTAATSGIQNVGIGKVALDQLVSGNYNTAIGYQPGVNYTTSESSNILISNPGTVGESNVCRIGQTGSGNGQVTDTYIAGNVHTNGRIVSVTNVTTATYTTLASDDVLACNRAGTIAVTLIASPATGQTYRIKDISGAAATNNITITPSAGNIDGGSNYVINTNYGSIDIVYTGTKWSIV